jgi:hypothetical protein
LKRRHALTRQGLITQASGRYETNNGATLVRVRFGLSVADRVLSLFAVFWASLLTLLFQTRSPGSPEIFVFFPFTIVVFVYVLIRLIALDDDVFLHGFLLRTLEAEDVTERQPA